MSNVKQESIIDSPKAGLCPDVWEQVMDATGSGMVWTLTTEARLKLEKVAIHLMDWMNIKSYEVHIVGSITSNQYSSTSDIDIHFCKLDENDALVPVPEETAQSYTMMLRAELEENFKDMYLADAYIGQHPIEVYFQGNIYQDYMSIGCYNLFRQRWLVGPELADPKFNPLSEYYRNIIACAEHTLANIRQQLLKTYEAAMVYMKTKNLDQASRLAKVLQDDVSLYKAIIQRRKACSTPTSVQDALKKRESKSWKISDATFKLIDKFGYMPILKNFEQLADVISSSTDVADDVASIVVQDIRKFLGDEKRIQEKEALHESKNIARAKQLRQVFESWNPDFDDKPQNEFGENWEKLDGSHWIVQELKKMAADCQINPDKDEPKEDRIYVWNVHKVEGDGPYIVNFGGGANGGGNDDKWLSYLSIVKKMAKKIFDKFGSIWLLDFDNDCCDDVWTLRLCFNEKKEENEQVNVQVESKLSLFQKSDFKLEESTMSNVLLAALLAVPGILPAKTIQNSIDKNQQYQMVMNDISKNVRMVGEYNAFQAANIIARTIYAEARNDGKKGMAAVASVIYNRAKGDKEMFAKACLKPKQFACWGKLTKEEADPKSFQVKIPGSVKGIPQNEKLWKEAMAIAADMLSDAFRPITDANMYYNDKFASPEWAKQLTNVKYIGSHKFGTLKNHAAFI